jgi:hypothetical protein
MEEGVAMSAADFHDEPHEAVEPLPDEDEGAGVEPLDPGDEEITLEELEDGWEDEEALGGGASP